MASEHVVLASTVNIAAWKSIVECLKAIFSKVNLEFTPGGMSSFAINPSETVYMRLMLEADKFQAYECTRPQIVGVDTTKLHDSIKLLKEDAVLTLAVEADSVDTDAEGPSKLTIISEQKKHNAKSTTRLLMMDVDMNPPSGFNTAVYNTQITMPTALFHQKIREFPKTFKTVEVIVTSASIVMRGADAFREHEVVLGEVADALHFDRASSGEIFKAAYLYEFLEMLTKCNGLHEQVTLCFQPRMPMIVTYAVGNMGSMQFSIHSKGGA